MHLGYDIIPFFIFEQVSKSNQIILVVIVHRVGSLLCCLSQVLLISPVNGFNVEADQFIHVPFFSPRFNSHSVKSLQVQYSIELSHSE